MGVDNNTQVFLRLLGDISKTNLRVARGMPVYYSSLPDYACYWTFPSYSEYEYEPDSDKFDLKSWGVLSLIYTDANFRPISRKI